MLQRLHNLVRHPAEIDRGAGPDAVESAYRDVLERARPSFDGSHPHDVASVMTLTFSPGLAPRAVFTLQAGSPLILTVSKAPVGLSGPSRVRSPGRPSPPARARPPRRSWPSTTHRPRAPRAAHRAELRCPPTRHHHTGASWRRNGRIPAGGVVAAAFAFADDRQRRTRDHAATAHPVKAGATNSHLRTRTLAVRRVRLQAQGRQVALPHQRAQARVPGWIKASRLQTLIPRQRPLAQALPRTCRR